jgi:crotonobetainyl-CoA:carnitine CoA-transferase CaiB-like acyl-CoA transferase
MQLSGLKVIDISTVLAGPSVGSFFAELGAEVIKIEHPKNADVTRSWKLSSENSDSTISNYFASVNTGKSYMKLDLLNAEDSLKLIVLLKSADLLISNFKKGDAKKFGLENDSLKELNPLLIHGKITGYGAESDRVAYDLILQAESGFMSMNGQSDSPPTKMPVALIDVLAAHHLKQGFLLALLNREKTNKGSFFEVSLYEAALSSLMNQASNYLMSNHVPERIGSLHPNIAPYGEIFKCKDEIELTFAIGSNKHFSLLCQLLSLSQLIRNVLFETNQSRVTNRQELFKVIQSEISNLDAQTILDYCMENHIPAGRIKNLKEVFDDEQSKSMIIKEVIDGQITKKIKSSAIRWK